MDGQEKYVYEEGRTKYAPIFRVKTNDNVP